MVSGIVEIAGKEYRTVARRVADFRAAHSIADGWSIDTELVSADDSVVVVRAVIKAPDGRVVGAGLAEENRKSSRINRTSAMENCETSAIGRALASCGFGGEEYASANEVQTAIAQQNASTQKSSSDRYQESRTYIRSLETLADISAARKRLISGDQFEAEPLSNLVHEVHRRAVGLSSDIDQLDAISVEIAADNAASLIADSQATDLLQLLNARWKVISPEDAVVRSPRVTIPV